jgi:hypothetical protein
MRRKGGAVAGVNDVVCRARMIGICREDPLSQCRGIEAHAQSRAVANEDCGTEHGNRGERLRFVVARVPCHDGTHAIGKGAGAGRFGLVGEECLDGGTVRSLTLARQLGEARHFVRSEARECGSRRVELLLTPQWVAKRERLAVPGERHRRIDAFRPSEGRDGVHILEVVQERDATLEFACSGRVCIHREVQCANGRVMMMLLLRVRCGRRERERKARVQEVCPATPCGYDQ